MLPTAGSYDDLVRENEALRRALNRLYTFRDLVGRSPVMQAVFDLARSAAAVDLPVLINGEPGTGKETLARAIHNEGLRRAAPFVGVPCAALTPQLLEAELFGHERGAFAGASMPRRGLVEAAEGGTLFLDGVGELPPKGQAGLLRLLDSGLFAHAGSDDTITADVRVIAACACDMKGAVASGRFTEELLRKLEAIPIALPPLRERREDIPALVEHLLERLATEHGRPLEGVSRDAMAMLLQREYPGNVRELSNLIERAIVCASGPVLQVADFGPETARPPVEPVTLDEIERRHIVAMLEQTRGNISQAARILDIDRVTLYNKIRKYSLRPVARQ